MSVMVKVSVSCQLTTSAGLGSGEGLGPLGARAPPQYEIIKKLLNYGYTQNL